MGMAASQARLLSITARMHDIEYKAQNIESQKIQLATQEDELYEEYCAALDAKKIQVAFNNGLTGGTTFVDANFRTVCMYDENRPMQYALRDTKTGKVIVSSEVYEMYTGKDFGDGNGPIEFNNDKYSFAWAMLGYAGQFCWDIQNNEKTGENIYITGNESGKMVAMTDSEEFVYNKHKEESDISAAYDAFEKAETEGDKREALANFRDLLYSKYMNEITEAMRFDKQDSREYPVEVEDLPEIDLGEFNYYVRLFEEIQSAMGCIPIDEIAKDGDTGNEWFNNMINTGRAVIDFFDSKGKKEWVETSVATSTNNNNLQEVADEKDLKKIEAKYEHELSKIKNKDKKFDTELSKLETERTALKTEQDAIKQVKNDNIERTFGIFS